ncbi:MAG: GGDEF domain-containing protein [Coriobacteriales bacterium]|jgi:diguanylate cyclase (GGDEF)-like protein|nr:GGDEF domain-containing protein [Coriobacteriales bacterium]
MSSNAIEILTTYTESLLYEYEDARLDVSSLPAHYRNMGEALNYLGAAIREVRQLNADLSKGKLDSAPVSDSNTLALEAKALQATLRRLLWQLEQTVAGNYKHGFVRWGALSRAISNLTKKLASAEAELSRQKIILALEDDAGIAKQESLLQMNSLFDVITSNSPQWIVITELSTGKWLFTNKSPDAVLNYHGAEDELQTWMQTRAAEALDIFASEGGNVCEFQLGGDDLNIQKHFMVSLYLTEWHNHKSMAFVFTDNTEARQRINALETLAYHDELTGVFNRYKGMTLLNGLIAERLPFVLCFVDLDDLKYINDVFGHAVGDNYITSVARLLVQFDSSTMVSRLGGDEFMLLSKGWTETDTVQRLEEIRGQLSKSSQLTLQNVRPHSTKCSLINPRLNHYSISFGVVEVGVDSELSASYVLARADERMYEYKRRRKAKRLRQAQ